ncbi:sugar-phosphatase [Lysinibacillus sp. 2017]|uniref:helix-turn-helix domain-containing protein n=1 Tax=unclassified Lysinibacillus TaxID=2636778 RepID=UPI000D525A6F|nr:MULTISPECIES: helix-turn-helix transcriptional regulator [unclassified Lysinibacillus]AWE07607.1 sugar-phosphatase [Lysinibacillus sp. 2017]TGN36770.1 XRE family transcriptional regulator [Lysinibacillus sp. S2017]
MQSTEESWGKLIKYHRQLQKLKQDDVAIGICTPSYLSRIENGIVIAEYSLYEQLFARLGIDLATSEQNEQQHLTRLEIIYEKLLSNELLVTEEIEHLTATQYTIYSYEFQLIHQLIYSRYLLSIKEDDHARALLEELEPLISWRKDRVTELYLAITAFAHLSYHEFGELAEREQKLQLAHYLTNAHLFEQANYHYHLAFANHRTYNVQKALHHIEIATSLFSHQYKPLFQLKLYSMKGVIFNDLHRFHEAITEFEAGLNLLKHVEMIQTPMQFSSLHNNIAYCYECQADFQKASVHYKLANDYEEDLHSIINWMRTCYQQQDTAQLSLLLEHYPQSQFTVPHHQYQRQLLAYALKDDFSIATLQALEEPAFEHFETQQYYALTLFYAPLWGQFYEQVHAYKRASHCYKLAYHASEKVRRRMSS